MSIVEKFKSVKDGAIGYGTKFANFFDDNEYLQKHPTLQKMAKCALYLVIMGLGLALFYFMGGKFKLANMVHPGLMDYFVMALSLFIMGFGASWIIKTLFSKESWLTIAKVAAVILPILMVASALTMFYATMKHGIFTPVGLGAWFGPACLLLVGSVPMACIAYEILQLRDPDSYPIGHRGRGEDDCYNENSYMLEDLSDKSEFEIKEIDNNKKPQEKKDNGSFTKNSSDDTSTVGNRGINDFIEKSMERSNQEKLQNLRKNTHNNEN